MPIASRALAPCMTLAAALLLPLAPRVAMAQLPEETIPAPVCDMLAAHPFDPGRFGRGTTLHQIDADRAVAACAAAVEADPGNSRLIYQLGRALEAAGQADEAQARYTRAADTGYVPAMSSLAILMLYRENAALTDAPIALTWLRRAADAGFAPALVTLGDLHAEGRAVEANPGTAVGFYRRAADTGNPEGQLALAGAYADGTGVTQDDAEAERLYRLAVAQNWGDALNDYAWFLYQRNRDLPEAERLARRALASMPEDGNVSDTLAAILTRRGRAVEALPYAIYAAARSPENAEFHERLGDTLRDAGRMDDAVTAWRRALELTQSDDQRRRLNERLSAAPAAAPAPAPAK